VSEDDDRLTPEIRAVAIVVIAGAIMSILDTTIVNVALETLSRELHADLSTIQWVSTGYLLALATVIPLTGWAAEQFGPKRVWMTAVAAFALTSALCGLAWSAESLICFRVLQGLAGGMIMPVGMITLVQAAGPRRMGRVMSVVGVPMLLAPVIGPVLGGLIVEHLSWRWIFYVNLPVGVLGLALAARLLPGGRAEGRAGADVRTKLDWKGLTMLSPGVALLVFGLSETGSHGSVHATDLVWMAAGLALIAGFVVHALHTEYPLVDIRLVGKRGFAAASATTFFVGSALFGAMLILPLYFQVARGQSPLHAGLLMAPQGLGAAIGMRYSGRLTDRIGGGRVVICGLIVLLIGTLPFTFVSATTSYVLLGFAVAVRGVGLGFTMMPAMAAAYATLERNEVSRATPMLNVVQRIGGSLGTAVLAVVLQQQLISALAGAGGRAGAGLEGVRTLPPAARARAAEPVASAFAHTYWWSFALTAAALVPAAILAISERGARRRPAPAQASAPIPG
jgi:EmrB/QacA subfamily drug resistance transporter